MLIISFSVVSKVQTFCSEDLSAFYLDILKDRLYTEAVASPLRQSTQALLKTIADALLAVLQPVTPFLTREIALELADSAANDDDDSCTFSWPELDNSGLEFDPKLYDDMVYLKNSFSELFASTIRSHFNCKSTFSLNVSVSGHCELSEEELAELLQVAHVRKVDELSESSDGSIRSHVNGGGGGLTLEIRPSIHQKCPRCWTFASESAEIPCPKCREQLLQIPVASSEKTAVANKQVDL